MWTEQRLKELAQQCRQLANLTVTRHTKQTLLQMADDYERQAAKDVKAGNAIRSAE